MASKSDYRIEKDSMGEVRVPASALYGAQTQRAVENFPVSNLRFPREFIRAHSRRLEARLDGVRAGLPEVPMGGPAGVADGAGERLRNAKESQADLLEMSVAGQHMFESELAHNDEAGEIGK